MTTLEQRIRLEVARVITNASNFPEPMRVHMWGRDLSEPIDKIAAALAPLIREREAEALEKFGHMYLNPEQDENYNKTARAGRGYYRALIETRAKRIRSNDE